MTVSLDFADQRGRNTAAEAKTTISFFLPIKLLRPSCLSTQRRLICNMVIKNFFPVQSFPELIPEDIVVRDNWERNIAKQTNQQQQSSFSPVH